MCVNDQAVMNAWEKNQGVADEPFIKFVSDPSSALTSALDMELAPLGEGQAEIDGVFGPYYKGLVKRCKRFVMYVMDGEIKLTKVAQALTDPAGDDFPEATLADTIVADIEAEGLKSAPTVGPPKKDLTELEETIKGAVAASKVVIFSKDFCPFCRATKELFDAKGVEYTTIEINLKEDAADWQTALATVSGGQRTVPNVFISGEHLGGADDTKAADESGKLDEMLGVATAK